MITLVECEVTIPFFHVSSSLLSVVASLLSLFSAPNAFFSLLIWCIINKFGEKKFFHHVKNEGKTNKDRQHPNFFLWGKYGVSIQTFCYQSPKPNNKKNHERGTKYSLTHWITLWMRKKWGEGRDEFLCSITLQLGATNRDEFHMSVIQPHSIILRMNHFRSKKLHTKISITSH